MMSRCYGTAALAAVLLATVSWVAPATAQDRGLIPYGNLLVRPDRVVPGKGTIVTPDSSLLKPVGRARTHHLLLIPDQPVEPPTVAEEEAAANPNGKRALGSLAETPASLACIYRLVKQTAGCDPSTVSRVAKGGTKAIGIVDAFHNASAKSDLNAFSKHFGLPNANIQVVFCNATTCTGVTTPPPACQNSNQCGWAMESALDIQAAHAMAPNAKIILVEAFSDFFDDLLRAVDRAKQLVAAEGGGQVSNSYGTSDTVANGPFFSANDSHFVKSGVVFFASTGDHKGPANLPDTEWPSTSPNVVGVGGTTILRQSATGAFARESAWQDGGGGTSAYATRPSYQNLISSIIGNKRGVPDVSADADPNSGMFVRCKPSTCGQPSSAGSWLIVGGTSLASPLMAGMANLAGHFRASSKAELTAIYNGLGGSRFDDVTTGSCNNGVAGASVRAKAGWDICTGVGTPDGKAGL